MAAASLGALLGAAALLGGPRGPVDWGAARIVVIESDDWGLCGFFPSAGAFPDSNRLALGSAGFPPAYWSSTLEDSGAVAELAALLGARRGRDGLPPVLQANMIVSALTPPTDPAEAARPDAWCRTDIPALPALYARPGLWRAVDAAIAAGVWRPEYHGAYHYDPDRRRAAVATSPAALAAAKHGVLLFPGSGRAWELGCWRSTTMLASELDRSLAAFATLFGRRPASIAAPDYVWDGRCEALWESRGLTVIQAKREQLDSRRPSRRPASRALKVVGRAWDRFAHPGRVYLDRNCRFEPIQALDTLAVARCREEIARAWRRSEPAVVESHRLNYVNLSPTVAAAGRRQLAALLDGLAVEPDGAPLYLTDDELAQLQRRGVSWTRRGTAIVVRNLTHAARLVVVPAFAAPADRRQRAPRWERGSPGTAAPRVVFVPAGRSLVLNSSRLTTAP
jgi:hypothetical protein